MSKIIWNCEGSERWLIENFKIHAICKILLLMNLWLTKIIWSRLQVPNSIYKKAYPTGINMDRFLPFNSFKCHLLSNISQYISYQILNHADSKQFMSWITIIQDQLKYELCSSNKPLWNLRCYRNYSFEYKGVLKWPMEYNYYLLRNLKILNDLLGPQEIFLVIQTLSPSFFRTN